MRLNPMTPAGRQTSGRYVPSKSADPRGAGARRPAGATATKSRPSGATATKNRPSGAATKITRPSNGRPATSAGRATHERKLRPRTAPSLPRRVSGPARPKTEPAPGAGRRQRAASSPAPERFASVKGRAGIYLRSLPNHRLIDRLVRGRAWIPVLGVMLAGIVAMQVEVLKLGANVGRSIESSTALQTRNEMLRASVAALSDQGRIERIAAGMGMIMPDPGTTGFLSSSPNGDLKQAIANIHAPDASSFLSSAAGNGSVATTSIMAPSSGSIVANLGGDSSTETTTTPTTSATSDTSSASSASTEQSTIPTQSSTDQTTSDQTTSDQTTSDQTTSGQATSGQATSSDQSQTAATESAPTQAAPTQTTQDQTAAPTTSPDGAASVQPSTPVGG